MKSANYICTLGPSNNSAERIERLMYQGMSCIRLNMCGTHENHQETISNVQIAKEKFYKKIGFKSSVAVAVDIQGPSIRTGKINEEFRLTGIEMKLNDILTLNENPKFADNPERNLVFIDKLISTNVERGFEIFLGDDIQLRIEDIFGDALNCTVIKGGILRNFMPVFIPKIKNFECPLISDKDEKDIAFAVGIDADFIFASYTRSGKHIQAIQNLTGDSNIRVFAKIQSVESLDILNEIINCSDGIISSPSPQFDTVTSLKIEKLLLHQCHMLMKPCFFSLAYMIDFSSLNEVSNWILENGNGFVLIRDASHETTAAKNMKTLQKVKSRTSIADSEPSDAFLEMIELCGLPKSVTQYDFDLEFSSTLQATMEACMSIAKLSDISVILVMSANFEQMQMLNHFHMKLPNNEIIVIEDQKNEKCARQINIFDKTTCLIYDKKHPNESEKEIMFKQFMYGINFSIRRGFSKKGDSILLFDGRQQTISVYSIPSNYKCQQ